MKWLCLSICAIACSSTLSLASHLVNNTLQIFYHDVEPQDTGWHEGPVALARQFVRRFAIDFTEMEAKVKHYLRLGDTEPGPWNSHEFRNKRAIQKATRRKYFIQCCGMKTCNPNYSLYKNPLKNPQNPNYGQNPNRGQNTYTTARYPPYPYPYPYPYPPYPYPYNMSMFTTTTPCPANEQAIAKINDEGVSVSCYGCSKGWQNRLALRKKTGCVPIICPGCPPDWESMLNYKEASYPTTKSDDYDDEENETDDEEEEDADADEEDEEDEEEVDEDEEETTTKKGSKTTATTKKGKTTTKKGKATTKTLNIVTKSSSNSTTNTTVAASSASTAAITVVTAAPVTVAPVTVAPVTAAPVTVAPVTAAAATSAAVPALPPGVTLPAGMTMPSNLGALAGNLPAGFGNLFGG